MLAGVDGEPDPLERIGRLGARLILQQALEDEVTEFLARVRYEPAEERVSYRNGYEPRRVSSGGASDANAFVAAGLPVVNLANGTERNHQPDERVSVAALDGMLDVAFALIDTVGA